MSKSTQFERQIRDFCLALPEATVVVQFGHPFYKWKDKPFAIYSDEDGEKLSIKLEKQIQPIFLEDLRFEKTPYVGRHGWVTLTLNSRVEMREVKELIRSSYEFVSVKKQKAKTRQT